MEKEYYILQHYSPSALSANDNGCINIFHGMENGKGKLFMESEKATKYKTIGEAMEASAEIYNQTQLQFKAVKYYEKD